MFCASAIIGVAAAFYIFRTSNMIHAMIAFATVAVAVSMLMLILELPLLALLQLFIMIGGISTYMFVGASSEKLSKFKHTNFLLLVTLAFIIAIPLIYGLAMGSSGNSQNLLSSTMLNSYVSSDLPFFYLIAMMLFGVGIGSIVIMKKLVAGK